VPIFGGNEAILNGYPFGFGKQPVRYFSALPHGINGLFFGEVFGCHWWFF
jgi:hypothetical protein